MNHEIKHKLTETKIIVEQTYFFTQNSQETFLLVMIKVILPSNNLT